MRKKLLLPGQNTFIQSPYVFPKIRFHINVAGYGAGKTSSLATAWAYTVSKLQNKRSIEGHKPRVFLGGVTLVHLEKTTLSYIMEDLQSSNTKFTYDKKTFQLIVGNVTTILGSLSVPQGIVGFDCCAAFCDEIDDLGSLAGDGVTFEAIKAVNERTRQIVVDMRKPFLMFASTSQGQKGLYRAITNFKKTGTSYVLIRSKTRDNWFLDPSYVESLYKLYSPQERLVYLEGHFLALAHGRVLGDFDWDKNFVNIDLDRQISPDEKIFWAQDFNQGYHRGCVGVLRGNIIYVVKSYEFPDIRDAPKVLRTDFPRNKILWIPDTTAKDEIRTFTRELHKYGIWWVTRGKNPNVEDSAFVTNKLLYTRRLIFTEAAKDHATDCSLAQRDKNNAIPKGIGPLSPIHRVDGVRMLCYFLCVTERALIDIRRATIQKHLEYLKDEVSITELSDGYAVLNPDILKTS